MTTAAEWIQFVEGLASPEGYEEGLCLDDYYQDLAMRDELEPVTSAFESEVSAADTKFRACTRPALKTRLSGRHWWHYRLPLRADEELLREAGDLGFLADEAKPL